MSGVPPSPRLRVMIVNSPGFRSRSPPGAYPPVAAPAPSSGSWLCGVDGFLWIHRLISGIGGSSRDVLVFGVFLTVHERVLVGTWE